MEKLINCFIFLLLAFCLIPSCKSDDDSGYGNERFCHRDAFYGTWEVTTIFKRTYQDIDSIRERIENYETWTFTNNGFLEASHTFVMPDEWYVECNPNRLILVNPTNSDGRPPYWHSIFEYPIESIHENRLVFFLEGELIDRNGLPFYFETEKILDRIK